MQICFQNIFQGHRSGIALKHLLLDHNWAAKIVGYIIKGIWIDAEYTDIIMHHKRYFTEFLGTDIAFQTDLANVV